MSGERDGSRASVSEYAAEWVMRLSSDMSNAERQAMLRWLAESPEHVRELLIATRVKDLWDSDQNRIATYNSARHAAPRRALIQRPPGYGLAAVARFVLTKGAYQRYVAPVIADMQFEYIDAIGKGRDTHARWIRIRGYGLVGWALLRAVVTALSTLVHGLKVS